MIKRTIGAAGLCMVLAGCQGLAPAQLAATATRVAVSPATVSSLQTWCQRGSGLIEIGRGQNISAAAKEIAGQVGSYCDALLGGAVPPTTDANTGNWLPENIAGLARTLGLSF